MGTAATQPKSRTFNPARAESAMSAAPFNKYRCGQALGFLVSRAHKATREAIGLIVEHQLVPELAFARVVVVEDLRDTADRGDGHATAKPLPERILNGLLRQELLKSEVEK